MGKSRSRRLMAALGVSAGAALVAGVLGVQADFVGDDFSAPRGLTSTDAGILVADQGGSISLIADDGSVEVVADGLPSISFDSPEGPLTSGPNAAIEMDGAYYFTVQEAGPDDEGFSAVYKVVPGEDPVLFADLFAYELANDSDGSFADEGVDGDSVSNPYDLVADGQGGILVSDSGANTIFHLSANGEISPYLIFGSMPNPLFPAVGGPTMDTVPTGLVQGPDGYFYVTTLTGFPFPDGGAVVYRFKDLNNNGDAMDLGESSVYADGLTTATNLAFTADGTLLVSEFSTNFLEEAPGRVVNAMTGEVVAAPLVSPTGLAVRDDGEVLVSMEFLGVVADVDTAAAIVAQAGPPPTEEPSGEPTAEPTAEPSPTPGNGGGTIAPPSTGDAGLADDASTGAFAAVAAGIVAIVATTAPVAAFVRKIRR